MGLSWQRQGFAAEAVRALVAWLDARGVTAIEAGIHPDHVASAAVARRVGLVPTGGQTDEGEQLWLRSP